MGSGPQEAIGFEFEYFGATLTRILRVYLALVHVCGVYNLLNFGFIHYILVSVSNFQLQFAKVIHVKLEEKNKKAAEEVKGVQSFLSFGISSRVEGSTSANCC